MLEVQVSTLNHQLAVSGLLELRYGILVEDDLWRNTRGLGL